jgi:hypothetical protein
MYHRSTDARSTTSTGTGANESTMTASAVGGRQDGTGPSAGQGRHRNTGIKAGGDTYAKERIATRTRKVHFEEDDKMLFELVDMTMTASAVEAVCLVPQNTTGSKGTDAARLVPQSTIHTTNAFLLLR